MITTTPSLAHQFVVRVELAGFTSVLDMHEELSADFLAGFNATKIAERTFPEGVNSVVSASVSGDADDIENDEAKVFVSVGLNVSATSSGEAERIATNSLRLLANLADALAEQAGGSIELEEGAPDVDEVEQLEMPTNTQDQTQHQPDEDTMVLAVQHTGKAPQGLECLPVSPLWEWAGMYSGKTHYCLTKQGMAHYAALERAHPERVKAHLDAAQEALNAEIAANKAKTPAAVVDVSPEDRMQNAIQAAQDAFWAKIADSYPECESGDFPPCAQQRFDAACEEAAKLWVRSNLPVEPDFE